MLDSPNELPAICPPNKNANCSTKCLGDIKDAARDLEFERAGELRDEIEKIKAEINAHNVGEIAGK